MRNASIRRRKIILIRIFESSCANFVRRSTANCQSAEKEENVSLERAVGRANVKFCHTD